MNALNLSLVPGDGNPFEELKRVSVELELALLGAALMWPGAVDRAAPFVDPSDFSEPFLGNVWELIRAQHAQGNSISPLIVITRLSSPETRQSLQAVLKCTPAEFVARVAAAAGTLVQVPEYAKTVREFANRRRVYTAGSAMLASLRDPGQDMRAAAGACSAAIEQALNAGQTPKVSVQDMIRRSIEALENPRAAPGYTTGLRLVDKLTGGFVPGDLIVTGARPSMGKSAFSLSTALGSALASYRILQDQIGGDPWSCLILSQEMTHEQCIQRLLTDIAYDRCDHFNIVEYQRFRPAPGEAPRGLTMMQRDAMRYAADLLPTLPLAVDGRPGLRVSEVTALIRQHKRRMAKRGTPLRLVVVDHIGLGKVLCDQQHGSRVDELGEITSALKTCAVNEDVCVNACHQLSRALEGRENKRPTLADFRDSGHIEQDADVMLGLYRDAYYYERTRESDPGKDQIRVDNLAKTANDMEAFVLKSRMGKTGVCEVYAHMGANAIRTKHQENN